MGGGARVRVLVTWASYSSVDSFNDSCAGISRIQCLGLALASVAFPA